MVNEKNQVLQLLPKVPPAVCGVGDYAWRLAQSLEVNYGIQSSFLSAGTTWKEPVEATEFSVYRLPDLSVRSLVDFVASRRREYSSVILHLSSYGFQKRGVPLWLAAGWQQLSQIQDRPRLLTMFHELAASGPVTSSAFWLRPLQQWVVRRIALASDGLRTNRAGYAAQLCSIPGMNGREIVTMPVFSNFGEPKSLPTWNEREPAMFMFGWGHFTGETLEVIISRAAEHCRRLGLSRLHVLGGGKLPDLETSGVELRGHGFMAADDISRLLLSCRMAYNAYNPEYFGKSTLMAAFASHGLVVICQGKTPQLSDGLHHGVHVLNEADLYHDINVAELPFDKLAEALRNWYDQHSLSKNAASYAGQLQKMQNPL